MIKPISLATFSALLVSLSQANPLFNQGVACLTFFSLIPLFIAWISSSSFKETLVASLVYAFLATFLQWYWLAYFGDFSIFTLGGTIAGYLIYFGIYSLFIWPLFQSNLPYKFFLLAASWTFYEVIKSTGFLAYPWGLLAHPLHNCLALVQVADLIGVFGISFFVALTNGLLSYAIVKANKENLIKPALLTGLAFGFFYLYGLYKLNNIPLQDRSLAVLLVQPNEDPWGEREEEVIQISLNLSLQGLKEHPDTQLVIWSETLLKRQYFHPFYSYFPYPDSLHQVLSSLPVHWLIGAPTYKKENDPKINWQDFQANLLNHPFWVNKAHKLSSQKLRELWIHTPFLGELYKLSNSVLLLSPKGEVLQTYSKRQLVPFAENIPFLNIPLFKQFYSYIGLCSQWAPGQELGLFNLVDNNEETYKLGVLICFEDAFDLLARQVVKEGAQILVNLSNDSWSKTVSAEWQHYIVAKFRAIENKRTLIRATNGGVSSIIDPWGRELASLPLFESCFLAYQTPIYTQTFTFFTSWGDWFLYILGASFLASIIYSRIYKLDDHS